VIEFRLQGNIFPQNTSRSRDDRSMRVLEFLIVVAVLLSSPLAIGSECQSHSDSGFVNIQSLESAGTAESQFQLGRHYEYGICVEQDDMIAIDWYRKAGTNGSTNANYRLGVLYENGWGTDVDEERAVTFYTFAAVKNHALAQYDLALMYFEGSGVEQDFVEAYKWLFIATNAGNEIMREQLIRVADEMTEDEIVFAQALALKWISRQRDSSSDQSG